MASSSQILHLDLTSKDEAIKPFWNDVSQVFHAYLWLPHKTVSQEPGLALSRELLNYQEEKSDFWKKTLISASNLIRDPLSLSSQASSILATGKGLQNEESKMIVTKKIRIYPKNKDKYLQALHTYRRAYNLSVAKFIEGVKPDSELRRSICDQIKSELPIVYDVNLIYEAYRKATVTRNSIISKRVKKQQCSYSYMSWKNSPKYFIALKLGVNGSIYPKQLGEVFYSEFIHPEARGKCTTVVYENEQWFACTQKEITLQKIEREEDNIIALDPGVRTFLTGYNENQVEIYGENFAKEKLLPLALSIDKLISLKDKLNTKIKTFPKENIPQFLKDQYRCYEKKIARYRARINSIVVDLHNRVAYDLVTKYDTILLPTFETSKMTKKEGKRKIRRSTVRNMLSLCHYKFKLKLKWMAKKYGKTVIDVNEAYTSKTFAGKIFNVGSKKVIKTNKGLLIDRDINGARNILIRFITKFALDQ